MSWEARSGCSQRYYTRSRRVAGRVVRDYVGTGPAAEIAATLDAARRTERAAEAASRREEITAIKAARAVTGNLSRVVKLFLLTTMKKAGFKLHAGSIWRKCRMPHMTAHDSDADDPLLARHAGPRTEPPTTEELRRFLRGQQPAIGSMDRSLFRSAEEAWLSLIAGSDPAAREAITCRLAEFRASLGSIENPLEQVLYDQVVVAWLELHYLGTRAAESLTENSTDSHCDFLSRGADRASRKFSNLMKELIQIRKLLGSIASNKAKSTRKGGTMPSPRHVTSRDNGSVS